MGSGLTLEDLKIPEVPNWADIHAPPAAPKLSTSFPLGSNLSTRLLQYPSATKKYPFFATAISVGLQKWKASLPGTSFSPSERTGWNVESSLCTWSGSLAGTRQRILQNGPCATPTQPTHLVTSYVRDPVVSFLVNGDSVWHVEHVLSFFFNHLQGKGEVHFWNSSPISSSLKIEVFNLTELRINSTW